MPNKKQKILLLVFFAFAFLGVIFGLYFFKNNKLDMLIINGKKIRVETVSDQQKMELGLGGRESLCADCGMLFSFSQAGKRAFWMKGMKFSLDILWIENNKIVHIEKNIPADFAGIMAPGVSADSVLEINARSVDRMGIKEGDSVSF